MCLWVLFVCFLFFWQDIKHLEIPTERVQFLTSRRPEQCSPASLLQGLVEISDLGSSVAGLVTFTWCRVGIVQFDWFMLPVE